MFKKGFRLLIAALIAGLFTVSCNETFAPEVNFGDKTYVNDYSALAEQVKTIADRIELLNKILDENFEGIKVSIDNNTNAIKAQTDKMTDGLDNVVATLFNGFTALNCKINSLGEQIVYAINEQGEIIELRIKENGVLTDSSFKTTVADLLKAINSSLSSLESRYAALNEALEVGIAILEVNTTNQGEAFLPVLVEICDALKNIDLSILKGFETLKTTQQENGQQIVSAINAKGDILISTIDESGRLINTAIVGQTKDLVKVINNSSAKIADRLNALNTTVYAGLATIKIHNDAEGEAINAVIEAANDLVKGLTTELLKDFTIISEAILDNGQKLIKAINKNGDKISLSVDKNGELIAAHIDNIVESIDELAAILNSTEKTLADKIDALNSAISCGIKGITCSLNQQNMTLCLKLNGIENKLFEGFSTLNQKIGDNGYAIMHAIDNNGQLISTTIDNNGQLIAAKFQCTIKQLVDAINGHKTGIEEKINALSTAVEFGLANVNVTLGNIGGMIDMEFANLNDALRSINGSILEGYKLVSLTEFANGEKIAKAINDKGDKIAFTIGANGQLICAKLDGVIDGLEDLIAVLEDQNKCLEEKFNTLNKSIADGSADIKLAIEEQTRTLDLSIGGISSSLLEGFEMLNTTIVTEDEKLIYAINDNGQIIKLAISNEGALLRTSVEGLASDLVDAINSLDNDLGKKLKALTSVVETGLARIEVKVGETGDKLDVSLGNINDAIKDMDATLLEGFTVTGKYMFRGMDMIVRAINGNGEKIAAYIDKNGNLIEVKLAGVIDSINDLIAAMADEKDSLNDKFDLLNKAVADGLEGISASFNSATKKITLKLGDIQSALFDGFEGLKEAITTEGERIMYAVSSNGELIALKIGQNGELLNAALEGNTADIVKAINDQTTGLKDCIDYLNFMVQTGLAGIEVKFGEIGGMLDVKLTDINKTLKGIKSGVLEGFTVLGTQMGADNQTIVDAINKLGEKISLTINENGYLIHLDLGSIEDALRDLIAYLESTDNDIADKLDALNKGIQDKVSEVTAAINGETGLISAALGNVSLSFLNGFTALNSKFDDLGNAIASAINKQGEGIILKIDEKGNLLNATMALGADAIVNALKDQNKSLAEKLDALNDALAENFLGLSADLDAVTGAIKMNYNMLSQIDVNLDADLKALTEALKSGLDKIFGGLTTLGTKIDANGDLIVKAINTNGEAIKLQIKASGEVIEASLDDNTTALINALKDQNTSLEAKLDALNDAIDDGFEAIKLSVGDLGTTITTDLGNLQNATSGDLAAIKKALEDLLGGLTTLNVTVGGNGDKIVTALNANGEAIKLQIKASGELIEASLDENTTALINALKDQNTSLETKLGALGDIIEKGLGDIKVEFGNLYGELKLDLGGLGNIIKEGFKGVTDGLTELKSEMNADGTAIVNAITGNGDLIQGQIDASGKLIEAAINGNTKDIKDALTAQATGAQAIADKVGALNTTVQTGLGDIKTNINAQTGKIETGFNDLSGKLGNINTNILNGFDGVKTNLDAIMTSINAMRDTIKIHIDANTDAILKLDTDLKASLDSLVKVVDKIGGNIVVAINGQKEAIVLALGPDGSIVGAVNAGAVKIADAISAQTTSLTALLKDADGGLPAILEALGTTDDDIKDILEFLKSKPDVDLSEIIELLGINNRLLTELLAISDGIYLDKNDKVKVGTDSLYNYIYITADVREAADKTAEVEEGLLSLLVGRSMAEPSKKQYCTTNPSTTDVKEHSHCFWKKVDEAKPFLKYTNVTTDIDNKSLLKMEKYYSESSWELKIHDVCSYAHIYSIQINDARDMDHYVQYYKSELTQSEAGNKTTWNKGYVNEKSGTTYMGPLVVKFVSYDKATGVYCDSPNVRVYCQLAGSGQGSSKDISDKDKDGTPYPDGTYNEGMKDDGYWTSKSWTELTKVGDTAIATFDK